MNLDRTPLVSEAPSTPARSNKWPIILAIGLICALAFGLRCLHLLNDDHFFVVSPDSYYFHSMARLLVQDETYFYPTHNQLLPIAMFSGITYPLALLATLLAVFTPTSTGDSLEIAAKLLPPALAVVTTLVLYLAVSRIYGRPVGLLSALTWALLQVGILHQAAGYLDRDCLSILLVAGGVFSFYFLTDPRASLGRWKWPASILAVFAFEALLYIEWGFLGPLILVAVLLGFLLAQLATDILAKVMPSVLAEEDPVRMAANFARGSLQTLRGSLNASLPRTLALILALNLVVAAFRPEVFRTMWYYLVDVFGGTVSGQQTVGELQGMGLGDILIYGFLLVPVGIGMYVSAKRRNRGDLLALGWFSILFLAGLFAVRLFTYAAPAAAILAGIGLATLLDARGVRASLTTISTFALVNPRGLVPYLRIGLAIILLLVTLYASISFGLGFASTPPAAPDTEWYDALLWMRDNTAQDAVIMTWWNYGYWILDIARRVPVVDNGVHWEAYDTDIARVYCTADDSEASTIMRRYGAEYLVFSTVEKSILPSISLKALNASYGDSISIPPELSNSLYARSFSENFVSDAGLQRVYQSAGATDTDVVILALA